MPVYRRNDDLLKLAGFALSYTDGVSGIMLSNC